MRFTTLALAGAVVLLAGMVAMWGDPTAIGILHYR